MFEVFTTQAAYDASTAASKLLIPIAGVQSNVLVLAAVIFVVIGTVFGIKKIYSMIAKS